MAIFGCMDRQSLTFQTERPLGWSPSYIRTKHELRPDRIGVLLHCLSVSGSSSQADSRCHQIEGFPAFSRAMLASVSPRYLWCSSPICVIKERMGSLALVASRRPPIPTSKIAKSTLFCSESDRRQPRSALRNRSEHVRAPGLL